MDIDETNRGKGCGQNDVGQNYSEMVRFDNHSARHRSAKTSTTNLP
jgi:hypothetical protein